MYDVSLTLYAVPFILYSVHLTLYAVPIILYVVHRVRGTRNTRQCTPYLIQYTPYIVQCTPYIVYEVHGTHDVHQVLIRSHWAPGVLGYEIGDFEVICHRNRTGECLAGFPGVVREMYDVQTSRTH